MQIRPVTYLAFNFWLVLLVSGFYATAAHAQVAAPNLICASVEPSGNVLLTWEIPAGAAAGNSYRVLRDLGAGAGFEQIALTTGFTMTTYIDATVDATLAPVQYRLQTVGSSISAPGNIVSTIYLTIASAPQGNGAVAQLNWNFPYTGTPPPGNFVVSRTIENGSVEVVATPDGNVLTALDTIYGFCDSTSVEYTVAYQTPACQSLSQPATIILKDNLGAGIVPIETVLINPSTGDAEIYWYPLLAPDLDRYLIQEITFQNGQTVALNQGNIQAGDPTVFTYFDASLSRATNLVVIGFDDCGNEDSYENFFTTMFARTTYLSCDQDASISWGLI